MIDLMKLQISTGAYSMSNSATDAAHLQQLSHTASQVGYRMGRDYQEPNKQKD